MKTIIDKQLQAIEKALHWSSNVPEAEQLQFRQTRPVPPQVGQVPCVCIMPKILWVV